MVLGRIAAGDQEAIAVGQVVPVIGHRSPAESGPQRGHGGGVSEAGLMVYIDYPQGPVKLRQEIALFIVKLGAAEGGHGFGTVHRHPGGGLGDEVRGPEWP